MNDNIDYTDKELLEEERINSYLRGEMMPEEEKAFLQELKADEVLKEKAVAIARMAKAMKEVGEERDSAIIQEMEQSSAEAIKDVAEAVSHKGKTKVVKMDIHARKSKLKVILSIAASLIVVFVLGYRYIDYRETTGLGNEYGASLDESVYMRGTDDTNVTKELHKLFANVKVDKELDATITRLAEIWIQSTSDTYNDYTNYAPQIGWNLAIAYLKDNKKDEAKQTLEKLITKTEEGTVIRTKAEELLEKLK